MKNKLDKAVGVAKETAEALKNKALSEIRMLASGIQTQVLSDDSTGGKPFMKGHALSVAGVAGVAAGGIGWMVSDEPWTKWTILAGGALLLADYFVNKTSSSRPEPENVQETVEMPERYRVLEKLRSVSESIASQWDKRISAENESLLQDIRNSGASEKAISEASYKLFYVNVVKVSMSHWTTQFESADNTDDLRRLIKEYGAEFSKLIERSCEDQCKAYHEAQFALGLH